MVDTEVEQMMELVASKYALVVVVARRARQLVAGEDPEARDRPVSRALVEAAMAIRQNRSIPADEREWAVLEAGEDWTQSA